MNQIRDKYWKQTLKARREYGKFKMTNKEAFEYGFQAGKVAGIDERDSKLTEMFESIKEFQLREGLEGLYTKMRFMKIGSKEQKDYIKTLDEIKNLIDRVYGKEVIKND